MLDRTSVVIRARLLIVQALLARQAPATAVRQVRVIVAAVPTGAAHVAVPLAAEAAQAVPAANTGSIPG